MPVLKGLAYIPMFCSVATSPSARGHWTPSSAFPGCQGQGTALGLNKYRTEHKITMRWTQEGLCRCQEASMGDRGRGGGWISGVVLWGDTCCGWPWPWVLHSTTSHIPNLHIASYCAHLPQVPVQPLGLELSFLATSLHLPTLRVHVQLRKETSCLKDAFLLFLISSPNFSWLKVGKGIWGQIQCVCFHVSS